MYTYNYYDDRTYSMYREAWSYIYTDVKLPRPPRTLGRKMCGHDSTIPPLDFRSN